MILGGHLRCKLRRIACGQFPVMEVEPADFSLPSLLPSFASLLFLFPTKIKIGHFSPGNEGHQREHSEILPCPTAGDCTSRQSTGKRGRRHSWAAEGYPSPDSSGQKTPNWLRKEAKPWL